LKIIRDKSFDQLGVSVLSFLTPATALNTTNEEIDPKRKCPKAVRNNMNLLKCIENYSSPASKPASQAVSQPGSQPAREPASPLQIKLVRQHGPEHENLLYIDTM
tara:strand:+ start:5007 stop:5321 length:315 start_codon:yes stop_codon:yes gene_type:complete